MGGCQSSSSGDPAASGAPPRHVNNPQSASVAPNLDSSQANISRSNRGASSTGSATAPVGKKGSSTDITRDESTRSTKSERSSGASRPKSTGINKTNDKHSHAASESRNGGRLVPPSPRKGASTQNGHHHHSPLPRRNKPFTDTRWKALYHSYKPIDPADVHSVIDSLICKQINKLSPTEVTFLQRTIRHLGLSLAPPTSDKTKLASFGQRIRGATSTSKSNEVLDARTLRDRHHLLDESLVRRLWTFNNATQTEWQRRVTLETDSQEVIHAAACSDVDPIGAAYYLLMHLTSTSVWDRVASIAEEAAKHVGLVLDVNHPKVKRDVPIPMVIEPEQPLEVSPGVTFGGICFLEGLALRGSRMQRLQLLYFLMLPLKTLTAFMGSHPAGGIPTWLLEADNDVVLSLPSLSHYYYFGTAFLPTSDGANIPERKVRPSLLVPALGVMETVANLLNLTFATAKAEEPNSERTSSQHSEKRGSGKNQTIPKVSSTSSLAAGDWSSAMGTKDSAVMETLQDIREGRILPHISEELKESTERFWKTCEPYIAEGKGRWTIDSFAVWAEEAIDDVALDAIMRGLFATGNIPGPETEKEMVLARWKDWQQNDARLWASSDDEHEGVVSYLSQSVQNLFHMGGGSNSPSSTGLSSEVWGGIGGFDGLGGLGKGITYCLDKEWWKSWEQYVGWDWNGGYRASQSIRKRPKEISTEHLLDRSSDSVFAGTFGSYEVMKSELVKGVDYVLIPPGVWDVLYELYGGGPPLPRMVIPQIINPRERTFSTDSKQMEDEDFTFTDTSVEVVSRPTKLQRIPDGLAVATHPWIFHCHLSDSQQPYRRGDAGPMSIRVMATPDQPLWRVYAEIIVRLSIHTAKAKDKNGRGQARLWKRIDPSASKDAIPRYGPWSLLCKNRVAILPATSNRTVEFTENYDELKKNWQAYADHATVEGVGLANGDRIMLEYAILNKSEEFIWPREAAAKAGRARRIAEEDLTFRRTLKGIDDDGKPLDPPPTLEGMKVDAMDISGRWFQVQILHCQEERDSDAEDDDEEEAQASEEQDTDAPDDEKDAATKESPPKKFVKVDFTDCGGHPEWINVASDRLAVPGRFTLNEENEDDSEAKSNGKNGSDAKGKGPSVTKKTTNEASDQSSGKLCPFPGYGACGLANLGNTCYANSAIQCVSYLPLLRQYLLSSQYKASGDLNKDNPLGTGGKLLEEFAELLRVMWSGKYGERSPTRFRGHLGKAQSQFSGADQQDAQEVLGYLIDVLHEDSNKVKKKPYVEALEDDWVKANSLPRVGDEAWRRFLRRNRSIMADIAMGQVLNTVTCPVCHFRSRNFDAFNLLSLPFPTVADAVFKVTLLRRGTVNNTPHVLNRPKRGESKRERFSGRKITDDPQCPSNQLVLEQYAVAMSRLADLGDLKMQLQNLCGIPATALKLYKMEEVVADKDAPDNSPLKRYMKVTSITEKEDHAGPQGTKISSIFDSKNSAPAQIMAYETTIHPRYLKSKESSEDEDADNKGESETSTAEEEEEDVSASTEKERRLLQEVLQYYGDKAECRVYDTDPLPISKAISRCLWPSTAEEFRLGLRVDAIDHREHWFPGSVVEIIEGIPSASDHEPNSDDDERNDPVKTKVRIHFDNFSSKWDETYTIDHFIRGQVRPLFSHATPRARPTEFMVHHRYHDSNSKTNVLIGQPFFLQCQSEWSTARAGAHILAQAARFLQKPHETNPDGPIDTDTALEVDSKVSRLYDKAHMAINDLIDLLVECDRAYVRAALGMSFSRHEELPAKNFRNHDFDSAPLSAILVKKVGSLLHRLPFEVRVCVVDEPAGNKRPGPTNEDAPFPFSLMRGIGNFMNARHAIALHWQEFPREKRSKSSVTIPVMYVPPTLSVHKASASLLQDSDSKTRSKTKSSPGSGGVHLSVCLTEFFKEQQLGQADSWRCPQCKDFREGKQHMNLWRLPDLLTFHMKRFNSSARWHEKVTTKVNFPLTGFDTSEWCHHESPALAEDSYVYDLIGVMNHYGSMTGGHYVATCKATACSPEGSEEVAYAFSGAGTSAKFGGDGDGQETNGDEYNTKWRLGGRKDKDSAAQQSKLAAAAASRAVSESAEPLWLQFDDDLVEPIPPRNVVSESAYVLFYRRRRLTPASIAKYSALE